MASKKKFPYVGDIIAIVSSFGLAAFSYFTSVLIFASFYTFIGLLRLIILLVEIALVRKNDDLEVKFKKERIICRVVGLIIILSNSIFVSVLVYMANKEPSSLFSKYTWIVYGYAAFAFYKIIAAFISLSKARSSYSPYKETICFLSFIAALMTMLTTEVTLIGIFATDAFEFFKLLEMMSAGVIGLLIYVIAIIMMVARRVPKEIQ